MLVIAQPPLKQRAGQMLSCPPLSELRQASPEVSSSDEQHEELGQRYSWGSSFESQ